MADTNLKEVLTSACVVHLSTQPTPQLSSHNLNIGGHLVSHEQTHYYIVSWMFISGRSLERFVYSHHSHKEYLHVLWYG